MIPRGSYSSELALRDAAMRELERRDRRLLYPLGDPSDIRRAESTAKFGEACRAMGVPIKLPFASQDRVNQFITIINGSPTERCTVRPQSGETINGAESVTLGPSSTSIVYVFSPKTWIVTTWTDATAIITQTPIWEWNGLDTTQFLPVEKAYRADSASIAVESYGGENWIAFTVNGSANYTYRETQLSAAPIDIVMPTANYRITYDMAAKTLATGASEYLGAGAMVRWVTGTDAGTFYAHYVTETSTANSSLTRVVDGNHSSAYRDEAASYVWDATDQVMRCSLDVKTQTLVADAFGTMHGWTDTDAAMLTAAGVPGLICGHVIGTVDLTCAAYFKNIKVWDLGA